MTLQEALRLSGLPANEARLLMRHITGLSKEQLIANGLDALDANQLTRFQTLALKRLQGHPIAYLIGEREFYGRSFTVTPDVLIPRPETEGLVEVALHLLGDKATILDLGTGSGAIAISLSCERPGWHVVATDNALQALHVARQNCLRHGARVHFVESDWYKGLLAEKFQHTFDLIIANPPYIAADDAHLHEGDLRFEPQSALTDHHNGLSALSTIIGHAHQHLVNGGHLWVEHGYNQAAAVRTLFHQAGFQHVHSLPDLAGIERLTGGHL